MNPELSVILSASGGYTAVRRTVQRLKRQSSANRMELIIVGFDGPVEIPPQDAEPFASHQSVALDRAVSVATANAEGVRRARAPIVVFGEDHCFPEPGWAEALIDAHAGPHAAVGPVFRNGNPRSVVSWCDFLIGYAPWMEPCEAGPRSTLPGHNSSYKRSELLAYGDRLADMLESETVLHYDLGRRGRSLFLEPRARVAHLNFALLPVWFKVQFYCGWVFGGFRAGEWPLVRRVCYAAASPLIPLVRFVKLAGEVSGAGRPRAMLWRVAPMLLIGLTVDGIGQFMGYLFGPGQAPSILASYEYNRVRFISEADRGDLEKGDG